MQRAITAMTAFAFQGVHRICFQGCGTVVVGHLRVDPLDDSDKVGYRSLTLGHDFPDRLANAVIDNNCLLRAEVTIEARRP